MSVNYQVVTDFKMNEFSPGEWELTEYTRAGVQNIEIPAEIDGKKIKKIGKNLFCGTRAQRIKVSEGIETIGKDSFISFLCSDNPD